jgi:hypothetical protein
MSDTALKLLPGESLSLRVRIGSREEIVAYVGAAEADRFHFVRRLNGDIERIHDTQTLEAMARFSRQALGNLYPRGRWSRRS